MDGYVLSTNKQMYYKLEHWSKEFNGMKITRKYVKHEIFKF